jgi:hypothetical protein
MFETYLEYIQQKTTGLQSIKQKILIKNCVSGRKIIKM